MLAGSNSPSKPPTPLTSRQVTTKLCTVVYSLGFNAARSGCSQTPKWSPYCRAQQCVPWEMRATITSSRGHLFKDNKPGLSMLGFYGVVPALKATTGANLAPTRPTLPHLAASFCQWIYHLGSPLTPHPHWHPLAPPPPPSTSGPPVDEIITLKVGWSARHANSWGNTNCDQEFLWDKGKNILWLRFGKLQRWQENNTTMSIISYMWWWCPQVLCATGLGSLGSEFC